MNTETQLQTYHETRKKIAAYQLALNTLNWDASTVAPKAGADYRNQMGAILAGEYFSIITSETYMNLIEALSKNTELDDVTAREIHQIQEDIEKSRYIPKDLYIAFSQLTRDGETLWEKAKDAKDYGVFKEMLGRLVQTTQAVISTRHSTLSVYEQLLLDFEPGFPIQAYDEFFTLLREKLVPLIHQINALKLEEPTWLSAEVPIQVQREVVQRLAQLMDYNSQTGLISESAHPFSSGFSALDNRVTVKYHATAFTSSIFALIHEIGHATYNGQVDPKWDGHHVRNSMSYGMHESQSRFFENMLGRTAEFWMPLYPFMQANIPALKDVSLDAFMRGINHVQRSLIRIEADELTYPLHIMIRYEIEKGLFDGSLTVENLDEVWADKYEAYLGVRPQHASEGVLQDIHWSGAAFGYFPTYALGSAYAAQWMKAMRQEMDVELVLKEGRFKDVKAWLKEKIHQYGGLYSAQELLLSVTHEKFNPQYYVDYLKDKVTKLYHL